MTDTDIIKALECLTGEPKLCRGCPYDGTEHYPFCREHCAKDALALINRQKAEIEVYKHYFNECLKDLKNAHAEIERLQDIICVTDKTIKKACDLARSEAIKEFAEMLKEDLGLNNADYINNLAKKLTEERDLENT